MPVIIVRPICAEDEPEWRSLWRNYLNFYHTELPDSVYCVSFARLIDPAVLNYQGLFATEGATPVGLAHYIFHRHGWQVEDVCYLQDLYVAPSHRGAGAARSLFDAVYDRADAAGCRNVYWLTQTFNNVARRLYDRVGVATPFIKYRR